MANAEGKGSDGLSTAYGNGGGAGWPDAAAGEALESLNAAISGTSSGTSGSTTDPALLQRLDDLIEAIWSLARSNAELADAIERAQPGLAAAAGAGPSDGGPRRPALSTLRRSREEEDGLLYGRPEVG